MERARKLFALANWKMAMTIDQSVAFVRDFQQRAGDLPDLVDVVICPPYTALWAVARALPDRGPQLGAQDLAATDDPAHTGQISGALLYDTGCRWVMLGHWEVRRDLGDDDATVRSKVRQALQASLIPIVFVGEGREEEGPWLIILERRLSTILAGCRPAEVATMALVYEPELSIGGDAPMGAERVEAACARLREVLRRNWGPSVAQQTRIIYGGSVTPDYATELLSCPNLDGLGASREGRDAESFARIVRLIAQAGANKATGKGER